MRNAEAQHREPLNRGGQTGMRDLPAPVAAVGE